MPTWLPSAGQWGTLPNSQLDASGVMRAGAEAIFSAWGGMAVTKNGVYNGTTLISGAFLLIWGGGHTDYDGNELYAYGPLENDSPQFYRLRDATSPAPNNVDQDGSGNPVSRHTYSSITVSPLQNYLISIGGFARYTDSAGVGLSHRFDLAQSNPNVNQPWGTVTHGNTGDAVAYEESSGRIWYAPVFANEVRYYDCNNNTQATAGGAKSPGWTAFEASSAIDQNRGIWAIRDSGGVLNFYRTNNGVSNDFYAPSTTGVAPTTTNTLIWDRVRDCFVVKTTGANRTLHFLTPPATNPYQGGNAWVWSSETPGAGSTPTAQQANGTFSRFAYIDVAGIRGYVLANAATQSIYFFRANEFPSFPPEAFRARRKLLFRR